MQDQRSLILHWCLFKGCSSDIVTSIFAHKWVQYCDYGQMPLPSPVSIEDERPIIIDTSLTFIFMIGQGMRWLPFHLLWWPILPLWMDATRQLFDCWMGKTVNCSCSGDTNLRAHLWDILSVIGCSTIVHTVHAVFIGGQYTVSIYYHLNQKPSRPLSFRASTIHIIWMMKMVGLLHYSDFSRQFTASQSIH
jgi:hypothetical protein